MIISERIGINFDRRGRHSIPSVIEGGVHDQDAIQFLKHIGIADSHIILAYCDCVAQLKSSGLWDKIYVWYPFIGASSFAHSHNAKAFWLYQTTFNASPSHTDLGLDLTSNTQYMEIPFAPSALNQTSNTLSFYCNRTSVNNVGKSDFGAVTTLPNTHILAAYTGGTARQLFQCYNVATELSVLASVSGYTSALGMCHGTIRASNDREMYRNGTSLLASGAASAGTPPVDNYRLGLVQGGAGTGRRYCDAVIFNSGLTDAEVALHYQIINQFNVRLNRNA